MVWSKEENTHRKDGILLMNVWSENDMFDVFLMRYVDGLTYKFIGTKYNISSERIRQVIHKARFVLRRKYKINIKLSPNGEY
jgi:DNA-directed RNA polymerase sigma subunit (sigma70/sigma32)